MIRKTTRKQEKLTLSNMFASTRKEKDVKRGKKAPKIFFVKNAPIRLNKKFTILLWENFRSRWSAFTSNAHKLLLDILAILSIHFQIFLPIS